MNADHTWYKISLFCHRVEITLLEARASYTSHGFNIYNKPAQFAKVNPLSGKVFVLIYGEAKADRVICHPEFLADIFPNASLLPPVSDPTAHARIQYFIDAITRHVEAPMFDIAKDVPGGFEKLMERLEKIQALLPDLEIVTRGEYAMGKIVLLRHGETSTENITYEEITFFLQHLVHTCEIDMSNVYWISSITRKV
ncbi:hypothetical protein EV363DRAFT_1138544, partial [Boletus edulis]